MYKRIIAVLCIVAMLASLLAGCGGKNDAPAIKTPAITSITPNGTTSNQQPTESGFTVNAFADHWDDVRIWAWSDTNQNLFDTWPGEPMNDDGYGWYSYTVPDWVDYVIISGNGGTAQTPDLQVAPVDSWIIVYTDNRASVTYLDPSLVEDAWANSEIVGTPETYTPAPTQPAAPAVTLPPAPAVTEGYIEDLGGYWEQVNLKDGNFSLSVSALSFSQTVYNCTSFTLNMNVSMNAGTSCKDWQIWGRSGNTFVKIAKIYLPAGDGFTSQEVTFRTPVTFDAIAVTPTIVGGYSWSMGLSVTDVYYD